MHLRSIALKGFKSFPDRTKLEFAPGVSVVVGPNGSGKSNITDAVLWALGEQSPLAVRGQTMQDVIFAGGHGIPSRNVAEVEVVVDHQDAPGPSGFSEISVLRRLDRSGESEYRLNGARCRLVDILEVLSDTGLGKEMHSVVSQGRVEAVADRRERAEEEFAEHSRRREALSGRLFAARSAEERISMRLERALEVAARSSEAAARLARELEALEAQEREAAGHSPAR